MPSLHLLSAFSTVAMTTPFVYRIRKITVRNGNCSKFYYTCVVHVQQLLHNTYILIL